MDEQRSHYYSWPHIVGGQLTEEFSHCALQSNNVVFMGCQNAEKDKSGCFSLGERSFYRLGPATEKLLSRNLLCVRGTTKVRMSFDVDLRVCRPVSESRRLSSPRYDGATPASDWRTRPATLKITCWPTGSQCSCRSSSVAWSLWPGTRLLIAYNLISWLNSNTMEIGVVYRWICTHSLNAFSSH